MEISIPPVEIKIMFESSPLKSIIFLRRLPVPQDHTPRTLTIPAKIASLKLSGAFPVDMRIPPLESSIMIESNPLKSTILVLVRRLAVPRPRPTASAARSSDQPPSRRPAAARRVPTPNLPAKIIPSKTLVRFADSKLMGNSLWSHRGRETSTPYT